MANKMCSTCGTIVEGIQSVCPVCGFEFNVSDDSEITGMIETQENQLISQVHPQSGNEIEEEEYQIQSDSGVNWGVIVAIFITSIAVIFLWQYDWKGSTSGFDTKEEALQKVIDSENNGNIEEMASCFDEDLFKMNGISKSKWVSDMKSNFSKHKANATITEYTTLEEISSSVLNNLLNDNGINYHKIVRAYKTTLRGTNAFDENMSLLIYVYTTDGTKWYIMGNDF